MRKQFRDNHLKKNENGYTLVIVLMVLVVMSVIGLGLVTTTANTMKLADNERVDQATFYIAESGVTQRREQLIQIVNITFRDINAYYSQLSDDMKKKYDFKKNFIDSIENKITNSSEVFTNYADNNLPSDIKTRSEVTIGEPTITSNSMIYTITSIGTKYSDTVVKKKRIVSQNFKIDLSTIDVPGELINPKYAIHTKGKITLKDITVNGLIATESSDENILSVKWGVSVCPSPIPTSPKNCYSSESSSSLEILKKTLITNKAITFSENQDFILPEFPDQKFSDFKQMSIPNSIEFSNNGNNKLDKKSDGYYINYKTCPNGSCILFLDNDLNLGNFTISNGALLTIDVGNKNRIIYVNDLNILSSDITIKGSGQLTLLINQNLSITGGGTLNTKNNPIKNLFIYHAGTNLLEFAGGTKINGSLYTKQANIKISGGQAFTGNVYSGGKEVDIQGGSSLNTPYLLLAPNAKVAAHNTAYINGAIVANEFESYGHAIVTYNSSFDTGDLPSSSTSTAYDVQINYGELIEQ